MADQRLEFHAQPGPADDPGRASVVIGRVKRTRRTVVTTDGAAGDPRAAIEAAFATVPADLQRLAADLRGQGLIEPAQIVEASVLISRDPDLRALVDAEVAGGLAPVAAVTAAAEHFAEILAGLPDPVLAGRAADVRAVGRRLAAALGATVQSGATGDARVLIGAEVTADDLLLDAGSVVGALSVVGGAAAHVGIVARSLGVPVLFGIEPALLDLPDGTEVMLDTRAGVVVVAPGEDDRRLAEQEATSVRTRRADLAAARQESLSTRDGDTVVVLANVASAVEAELAVSMDALGVGLLRTEMPFLGATGWPTYAEHVAQLTPVLAPLRGRPVTVRTLDFADDKLPPFLRAGRAGPLGPSLPLMLAQPEAFGAQLRAILYCGLVCEVRVSIMFPMVDSVSTMQRCRALAVAAAADLGLNVPPVGAMVEMREAVAVIDDLAHDVDFFSIGTNDLTAAILGLGRRDPALTPARLREPAVLDAVAQTVRAGRTSGVPVSVCGDAASDPALVPDLLSVGCRTLSVAPSMVDEVRAAVRQYPR
jgi:phosphoenolpyruvate-protein kinase (PTS system EI component)